MLDYKPKCPLVTNNYGPVCGSWRSSISALAIVALRCCYGAKDSRSTKSASTGSGGAKDWLWLVAGLGLGFPNGLPPCTIKKVIDTLEKAIQQHDKPRFLRTDNGPEFIAEALANWAKKHGIEHVFNPPGKPWQNGKNESFNGRFRDECLNAEVFASWREARVLIEQWRKSYNEERPHSGIDYQTPSEKRLAYKRQADKMKNEASLT